MAPASGFLAKIRVAGLAFSGAEWSVEEEVVDVDVTNTEGTPGNPAGVAVPGFESHTSGTKRARVRIKQASFDPNENWFAAPRSVNIGGFLAVQIFPVGLAGKFWNFTSLLILQSNYNGRAKADQPLEFVGITDGSYVSPI